MKNKNKDKKINLWRLSIDLPLNLQKRLKALAAVHGKSMREIVIESIEQQLKKLESKTTEMIFKQ